MPIDAPQRATVEAAFSAAQQRTRAPIVCVLAHASANYEFTPLLASVLLGLVAPWPLLMFTQLSAQRIFLAQLVVCFAASAILMASPLRFRLSPARVRRANAHRAALAQFQLRELDRIGGRCGVLVYVSLAERYARVVAAETAAQTIPQDRLQVLVDALVADMRKDGPAEALARAARSCGDLLAPAFPPTGEPPQPRQHFHVV
jgi:putative membrane protein